MEGGTNRERVTTSMEKLKICLVSAVQTSFWGSEKQEYIKRYVPAMKKLAEKLGFDLYIVEKPVANGIMAETAVTEIKKADADFLLIQVSTFAAGEILIPFAELGLPIGLWGIPEVTDTGAIPNNSFCGVNMYASILKQYLGYVPKYKWFYGDMEDEMFINRFSITVRALRAVKHLKGAKIGLIGGIAPGFYDFTYDPRITSSKLGVKVDSTMEFSDVRQKAVSYTDEEIRQEVEELRSEYGCIRSEMDGEHIETSARVFKAFKDIVAEKGYDAVAISCWPKFRKEMGIVVCAVIGRLLEHGILAACEGDVDSIMTAMLMRDLTGIQPMLMDMSKFDAADQSVLMWHCGSAPSHYADHSGCTLAGHYKPGSHVTGEDDIKVVGVNDMYYGARPVTVARLTNDYKNMLLFSGSFIEKKDHSFDGSRGWVGNLKADGEDLMAETLVNTVLSQGYQHHYPIVEGHVEEELREIMAWLDIRPVEFLHYRHYLQTPTLE